MSIHEKAVGSGKLFFNRVLFALNIAYYLIGYVA